MTQKKDEYMRGYADGFKDGAAQSVESLRDHFAGLYMAGNKWSGGTLEQHVEDAYQAADVALEVRSRPRIAS